MINVILDAGKGKVARASLEATVGTPIGSLPIPVRSGYSFCGWYYNGTLVDEGFTVDAQEDITLTARWTRQAAEKKKSSLKRQKIAAITLACACVVLIATLLFVNYIVTIYPMVDTYYAEDGSLVEQTYYLRRRDGVYAPYRKDGTMLPANADGYYIADVSGNQYAVDPETGAWSLYARVDYDPDLGESLGYNDRVMLFPQIEENFVYSISVKNSYDSFRFIRNENGKIVMQLDGYDKDITEYNEKLYAYLCVSCGYTLSMQRLDLNSPQIPRLADGSVDYASYGLRPVYDEAGALTYAPTEYTITSLPSTIGTDGKLTATSHTTPDKSYSVIVGDRTPTGKGYYAQYVGRDAIYVLDADLENSLLLDGEELVSPSIAYPMTMATSYMVYDFELVRIKDYLAEDLEAPSNWEVTVGFSFAEISARENTVYSVVPYMTDVELLKGYTINDEAVSAALYRFVEMESLGCRALGLSRENLIKYNLDKDVHYIGFSTVPDNKNTETLIKSMLIVSQKTEQGTYYVGSYLYDMIVEVDQYYFDFLERQDKDWYEQYFISQDIAYVDYVKMELNGQAVEFTIDNQLSYSYYYENNVPTLVKRNNGEIRLATDGTYYFIPRGTTTAKRIHLIDFENGEFGLNDKKQVIYKIYDQTGRLAHELIIEPDASNLLLYSPQYTNGPANNPNRLNYSIPHTYINQKGETVNEYISAEDNFRKLWIQDWYWLSLEGDINDAEFEEKMGMSVEEYIATGNCYASIAIHVKDKAASMNQYYDSNGEKLYTQDNERYLIYRFYRYSDYKAVLTVEEVTEFNPDGTPVSDPTNVDARFYVLTTHLETIFEDFGKVLAGERVERD